MNLIKNRRGDKYLSVYWFVVLAIIVAGIFGMVYVFYGSPYDVREIEASVLTNRVADCVSYGGKISSNFIFNNEVGSKTSQEFSQMCNLNFKSSEWEEEQYYTEVNFYKLNDLNTPVLSVSSGNNNWLSSCELQEDKEEKNLPQCVRNSFYSVDDLNNQYIIKILSVVRKTEKNVKI